MQVTLIRHLPTQWNQNQKLQGKQNIPILPISKSLQLEIEKNKEKLNKRIISTSREMPDQLFTFRS